MGMFDEIQCKVPLPTKRGVKTAAEWKLNNFQTKDLDECMSRFEIRKSGLWLEKVSYEPVETNKEECLWSVGLKPKSREWVKYDFTGYVNFYDFIYNVDEENDLSIEFRAHFVNGKLQGKIKLVEWKFENNFERKSSTEKHEKEFQERQEFCNKWYFKYGLKYWNNLLRFVFKYSIKFNQWVGSKLWKIERWLTF